MSLSVKKPNLDNLADEIWKSAKAAMQPTEFWRLEKEAEAWLKGPAQ